MKTTVSILLFVSLFLFSCKKDDDGSVNQISPENQYLSKITKEDGSDYVLINYNPDKTIHQIRQKFEDEIWENIQYEYHNGRIRTLFLTGEGANSFRFSYDANGILIAYEDVNNEAEFPIEYNQAENSYEYYAGDDLCKAYVDVFGNIVRFSITPFNQDEEVYVLAFDTVNRGSLSNANPVALHTLIATNEIFFFEFFLGINLNSQPLNECQAEEFTINSENTFDANDFLKTATITNSSEQTTETYSYQYIEL